HRDDDIAVAGNAQQRARQLFDALEIERLDATVRADRAADRLAVRACDRRLTCRVDFRDDERIDARKHAREVIEQITRTCIAVGLEREHDSAARPTLADRFERCRDLRRMMTIVVDQRETTDARSYVAVLL